MTPFQKVHENAIRCSRKFQKAESELVEAILQVDAKKVYSKLGYASLFDYCVRALRLSESISYAFIRVARKSVEIPEIQAALSQGTLSVSQAKRIVSVVTPSNKHQWLHKAQTLKQRELERAVAQASPMLAIPERIQPKAPNRSELRCGVSTELEQKLRRIQDLLSQARKKPVTLEEAFEALAEDFLSRKDPVRMAQRNHGKTRPSQGDKIHKARAARPETPNGNLVNQNLLSLRTVVGKGMVSRGRETLSAATRHAVVQRDQGRCQYVYTGGTPCLQSRWTELHHKHPVSLGGRDEIGNLVTLCSAHHKHLHRKHC